MDRNKQYEENINLVSLFCNILRHWKGLLWAIVIGALLLGAYKGVTGSRKMDHTAQITALENSLSETKDLLTANESKLQTNEITIYSDQQMILANQTLIKSKEQYRETMEETMDSLQAGVNKCKAVLEDPGASSAQIADAMKQLPVLTEELAEVNRQISEISQQIRAAEGEIIVWQTEIDNTIVRNKAILEANADLEEELAEKEEELDALKDGGRIQLKPIFAFAILGGIAGALAFCAVMLVRYILYKKLRSAEELKEQYHLTILGEFYSEAAKQHGKLDRLLDQWMGDVQTLPEEAQVYELIAAGIQSEQGQKPVKLMVTGSVQQAILKEVQQQLTPLLPEGYETAVAANPVYNAELLANLKQYAVLLVEAKGISDKREIAKLAEVLLRNEVKVVGAVVR